MNENDTSSQQSLGGDGSGSRVGMGDVSPSGCLLLFPSVTHRHSPREAGPAPQQVDKSPELSPLCAVRPREGVEAWTRLLGLQDPLFQ